MNQTEVAVFAGGCFWCTEAVFQRLRGVLEVVPGYTGGELPQPKYEEVSSGSSGHAEAVQITFDPEQIKYRDLLEIFFATHDPTTLNRQGNDVGTQYRSAIFYLNDEQKKQAEDILAELSSSGSFASPVVTTLNQLDVFYPAEDYHKNYYQNNPSAPYCTFVIAPKLKKFKEKFTSFIKE